MSSVSSAELARRLGDHMRAWREENDLTLEKAGQRINVDLQQWHRWERSYQDGRNPTLKSLVRIADAMDIALPDLMQIIWSPED